MLPFLSEDKQNCYINDISHHHLNKIGNEYEVVLQNNSDYGIIEAQYFKGKLFLVVEWLGVKLT